MNDASLAESSVGQLEDQPSKFVGFTDSQYDGDGGSISFESNVVGNTQGGLFLEDGSSFVGGSESYLGGGSVVAALWSAQSMYDNHPLKLLLADTQQSDVFYLPPKKKDKAKLMQRKIDAQKASGAKLEVKSKVKVSAARRADSLVQKRVLKGKDALIEQKLLRQFKGLDGVKAKMDLFRKVKEKKDAAQRRKILAKNPQAFDPPPDPDVLMVMKEQEEEEANDDMAETFDLHAYEGNLWADSGSVFVKNKEVRALRQVLLVKRWIAVVAVINAGSAFCSQLMKARLKRSAVAHLWGSDNTMHAVRAIQKAFFRFRHLRYEGATETAERLAERKAALIQGGLRHAGHEETYEERLGLHRRRCEGAGQIILFLRDVHKCLSFKVAIRLFVNRIRVLQGQIRRHLAANKGRVEALTRLFDQTCPALVNHFHVIDRGPGLDTPKLNRAERAAVLRGANAGLSKAVRDSRVVRRMREESSFHAFLRNPDTHRDRLHHISFQAKMAQGRVMTDAGGTLIDPQVRRRVLRDFVFRRRRVWVSEVTRRLLHKGLETKADEEAAKTKYASECHHLCHASLLGGAAQRGESREEEEEKEKEVASLRHSQKGKEEKEEGGAVDPQLVQRFLMSSASSEDVIAIAMAQRLRLVDLAKHNYHAQKKQRQNNLSSQTTWRDMLGRISAHDLCLLFLEMERITHREREERERAEKELARQRRKSSRRNRSKRRGSVNLLVAMASESPLESDSASVLSADLSESSLESKSSSPSLLSPCPMRNSHATLEYSESSSPKPPTGPKPSSQFSR